MAYRPHNPIALVEIPDEGLEPRPGMKKLSMGVVAAHFQVLEPTWIGPIKITRPQHADEILVRQPADHSGFPDVAKPCEMPR